MKSNWKEDVQNAINLKRKILPELTYLDWNDNFYILNFYQRGKLNEILNTIRIIDLY
jgi:hypothetical protein